MQLYQNKALHLRCTLHILAPSKEVKVSIPKPKEQLREMLSTSAGVAAAPDAHVKPVT